MSRTLKELRVKRQGRHGAHNLRRRTASERRAVASMTACHAELMSIAGLRRVTANYRRRLRARVQRRWGAVARRCHPRPAEARALRWVTLAVALATNPGTGDAAPVGV